MSPLSRSFKSLRARRLRGGVDLPDYSAASLRSRIMPTPLPPQLFLPLPDGSRGQLLVGEGERVARNQVLIRDQDGLPVLHSPASGAVHDIRAHPVQGREPAEQECLVLNTDDDGRVETLETIADFRSQAPESIRQRLLSCRALAAASDSEDYRRILAALSTESIGTLIFSGLDPDPHSSSRAALLREHAAEIQLGIGIIQYGFGVENSVLAVASEQDQARGALAAAMADSGVTLMRVPNRYPAHHEQLLARSLPRKRFRGNVFGDEDKVLVLDIACAWAAARAVVSGEAMTSRLLTLTGGGLRTPKNFRAPLGTPMGHLLELCGADSGADSAEPARTVVQGLLTGFPLHDVAAPVTERSECLIALAPDEVPPVIEADACIRCGECVAACPVDLQPLRLAETMANPAAPPLDDSELLPCIECGACAWVCPSHIPLLDFYREARGEALARVEESQRAAYWLDRYEQHQFRAGRLREDKVRRPAPELPDKEETDSEGFSRQQAKDEIAAAVARVQARRREAATAKKSAATPGGDGEKKND